MPVGHQKRAPHLHLEESAGGIRDQIIRIFLPLLLLEPVKQAEHISALRRLHGQNGVQHILIKDNFGLVGHASHALVFQSVVQSLQLFQRYLCSRVDALHALAQIQAIRSIFLI